MINKFVFNIPIGIYLRRQFLNNHDQGRKNKKLHYRENSTHF